MNKKLILGIIFLFNFVHAKQSFECSQYLKPTPYGTINPWFEHNRNFDVELPPARVKNQCATGHCHLYAWVSELEMRSGIDLSNSYLDAVNLYLNAIDALNNNQTTFKQGAFAHQSRSTIAKYGLIPESAWQGRNISAFSLYPKLVLGVEAILTNTRAQIVAAPDEDKEIEIRNVAKKLIKEFILQTVGPIPEKFIYQNQEYTPKEFAKKFFPELESPIVEVLHSRSGQELIKRVNDSGMILIKIYAQEENFENQLRFQIDQGNPVYLTYNHNSQFVDDVTGIMSIEAFNYPSGATLIERDVISEYKKWPDSHAVLVVGYQKDPITNRIIKWKIQNSWGVHSGDKGYYYMYSDYMKMYGWGFVYVADTK